MKFSLFFGVLSALVLVGCAEKQLVVNGLICPAGHSEELVKADFRECKVYDLEAATNASKPPLSVECQKCLENKGYRIEK